MEEIKEAIKGMSEQQAKGKLLACMMAEQSFLDKMAECNKEVYAKTLELQGVKQKFKRIIKSIIKEV